MLTLALLGLSVVACTPAEPVDAKPEPAPASNQDVPAPEPMPEPEPEPVPAKTSESGEPLVASETGETGSEATDDGSAIADPPKLDKPKVVHEKRPAKTYGAPPMPGGLDPLP